MKRSLITTILLFSFTYCIYSQSFTGGVLGGVVASQVAGDSYSGYNKLGGAIGVYVNLALSEKWAMQMEFEYILKGSRHLSNPDKNDFNTYKLNISYLEVPVIFQYKFRANWLIELGISGAALATKKETLNGDDLSRLPSRPGFRKTNYNVILGFALPLNERINLGIRTNNSINSLRTGSANGFVKRIGKDFGQFNDALVLSLFYRV